MFCAIRMVPGPEMSFETTKLKFFFLSGNIFISYNTNMEECQYSGDEGFDENDTSGPRKRTPIYKIGKVKCSAKCFF